jgi:Fic family protein
MPELPIYPERNEAPGYALERRAAALRQNPPDNLDERLHRLRRDCAIETLGLSGAPPTEGGDDPLVSAQLEAIAVVEASARDDETLDLGKILEVHRLATDGAEVAFRSTESRPQFATARPSPPRFIEDKLKNLLGWLDAESARSMFPAERMALWFARFLEIAPFERRNFRTGHLLVSHFAVAKGYPVVSLRLQDADDIRNAVERALRFDTAALVAQFNDALSRALDVLEAP